MLLITRVCHFLNNVLIQFNTSSSAWGGGAYYGAAVGGKGMVSTAKLVVYAFAV